jgi:LacI family transcriptional regulator
LRDVTPALTTVRVPLEEVGEIATRMALGVELENVLVHTEVVLRESTRRDPPGRNATYGMRTTS